MGMVCKANIINFTSYIKEVNLSGLNTISLKTIDISFEVNIIVKVSLTQFTWT